MKKINIFITIEGIEGVGKSTAVKFIENILTNKKINFIVTREPGGTFVAEQIRQILLTPNENENLQVNSELLLMFAARAQHIVHVIKPALQQNKWVVSDRFVDASYAYQGGGRGIPLSQIKMLDDWIVDGLKPDLTILLDAPAEIGLTRAKNKGAHDRIEQEKVEFFDRVRASYLARAKEDVKRFRVIDATQSLENVQAELTKIIDAYVK